MSSSRDRASFSARPANFSRLLIEWYRRNHRDLPWRRTSDPYRIWISEIMLQQTRAAAVIPYFERFLNRFPTVAALAAAPEDQVLALWSGLGYYSRARNLRRAAIELAGAGEFPRDFAAWRRLPGVGDYTAAAVTSIAFGQPHAVLDGNVLRVVARVQTDPSDISAPSTRERFRAVAQQWLGRHDPAAFNQALMELGATVCLPRNPQCSHCPIAAHCQANASLSAAQYPVKLRRMQPVGLQETVLIAQNRGRVLLRQRDAAASRMAGFWDLPSLEDLPHARAGEPIGSFRHTITHHHYTFTVLAASLARPIRDGETLRWFSIAQLSEIPLSTTARKALVIAQIL